MTNKECLNNLIAIVNREQQSGKLTLEESYIVYISVQQLGLLIPDDDDNNEEFSKNSEIKINNEADEIKSNKSKEVKNKK